jgi:hypothetical protein
MRSSNLGKFLVDALAFAILELTFSHILASTHFTISLSFNLMLLDLVKIESVFFEL